MAYLQSMKMIALSFLFLSFFHLTKAQTAEDSVKAAVNKFFTAMKASDAVALNASFTSNAIMQTVSASGEVRTDDVKDFAKQIVSIPKDSADERIVFETVKVDANLAIVWAPYQFYYAGKFSHCGVDSFQLVREGSQWKIHYIIDTRRRKPCQ